MRSGTMFASHLLSLARVNAMRVLICLLILVFDEILTEPRRSTQTQPGPILGPSDGSPHTQPGCVFPSEWEGIWFQSTVRPYITILGASMSSKGKCVRSDRGHEKFILKESEDCFKCVVFHQKAQNVLQYKETFGCSPLEELHSMCRYIPGDANLYTMFRVDGQSVPCPFHGPLLFTYNRGKGECSWPKSEMESCTNPHKLVFNYQACPNVQGSEMMTEELECQANWRDGSFHFLVGKMTHAHASSDEDKFRCFIFEFTNPLVPSEGLQLAQSGDASCNGLFSPKDGSRTLRLTEGPSKVGCRFPRWLSTNAKWNSLDGGRSLSLSVAPSNLSFIELTTSRAATSPMSSFPSAHQGSVGRGRLFGYSKQAIASVLCHQRTKSSPSSASQPAAAFTQSPNDNSRDDVLQDTLGGRKEQIEHAQASDSSLETQKDYERIVLYQTIGCQNGFVCSHLYKVSENVARVKLGKLSRTAEYACDKYHFDESRVKYVLLLGVSKGENRYPITAAIPPLQKTRLPFLGWFKVTTSAEGTPQFLSRSPPVGVLTPPEAVRQHSEVDPAESRSLCPDGQTPRQWSWVMGCGHDRSELHIQSSCPSQTGAEAGSVKSFTCTHKWMEGGFQHLVFQAHSRSSTDEDEVLCFRVDGPLGGENETAKYIELPDKLLPGQRRRKLIQSSEVVMTKLDENCLDTPGSMSGNQTESNFKPPTHTPGQTHAQRLTSDQILLFFQGDCSHVSGAPHHLPTFLSFFQYLSISWKHLPTSLISLINSILLLTCYACATLFQ